MTTIARLFSPAIFAAAFLLAGCGGCTPAAAYSIPAYWDPGHYDYSQILDHYRPVRSCTHYYTDYYGRYGYHYRRHCSYNEEPVYRTIRTYIPKTYHPRQYVPAVVCRKGQ